jgi:hypothetical protein
MNSILADLLGENEYPITETYDYVNNLYNKLYGQNGNSSGTSGNTGGNTGSGYSSNGLVGSKSVGDASTYVNTDAQAGVPAREITTQRSNARQEALPTHYTGGGVYNQDYTFNPYTQTRTYVNPLLQATTAPSQTAAVSEPVAAAPVQQEEQTTPDVTMQDIMIALAVGGGWNRNDGKPSVGGWTNGFGPTSKFTG